MNHNRRHPIINVFHFMKFIRIESKQKSACKSSIYQLIFVIGFGKIIRLIHEAELFSMLWKHCITSVVCVVFFNHTFLLDSLIK